MSEIRRQPRKDRSAWPARVYRLGEEPSANLSASTTAEERLAMVWQITVDSWELAGRTIPDYPRHEMPIRILRPNDSRNEG